MTEQLTHGTTSFQKIEFPIILLLDNITGEANIGSIFRLADAFGVGRIIFCGSEPNLNSNRLKRTARNTYKTVPFEFHTTSEEIISDLKKDGYQSIAIEITSDSRPIHEFKAKADNKILLIAGNERHGISKETLEKCTSSYHIEMFGKNSSMNVSQSMGIALYELTKALKQFHKK